MAYILIAFQSPSFFFIKFNHRQKYDHSTQDMDMSTGKLRVEAVRSMAAHFAAIATPRFLYHGFN